MRWGAKAVSLPTAVPGSRHGYLSQTPNMTPCQCVYSARRKISFWGSCWYSFNQQSLSLVGRRISPQVVAGHCGCIYSSSPIFANMLALVSRIDADSP